MSISRANLSKLTSDWHEVYPPRPLLKQLHWSPIASRIQYKLCTSMFDVGLLQYGTAPVYLSQLCERNVVVLIMTRVFVLVLEAISLSLHQELVFV